MFLAQTGEMRDGKLVPGERFPDVPVFSDLLKPKLKDPKAIKAFEAWETLIADRQMGRAAAQHAAGNRRGLSAGIPANGQGQRLQR